MSAPHALAVREFTIDDRDRAAYLSRLAQRRTEAAARGAHVWAFEREHAVGEFIEFMETNAPGTLADALAHDPTFAGSTPTIYHEVVPTSIES